MAWSSMTRSRMFRLERRVLTLSRTSARTFASGGSFVPAAQGRRTPMRALVRRPQTPRGDLVGGSLEIFERKPIDRFNAACVHRHGLQLRQLASLGHGTVLGEPPGARKDPRFVGADRLVVGADGSIQPAPELGQQL